VVTPVVLSIEELVDLTGYKQPSRQIIWLKKNGFKYRLNRFMHPKVDRTHYTVKMGIGLHKAPEPDWGASK